MTNAVTYSALLLGLLQASPTSTASTFLEQRHEQRTHVDSFVRKQIAERNEEMEDIYLEAKRHSDQISAGTAYNNIHIQEHRCFVIAHYMGRPEHVRHLKNIHEIESIDPDPESHAQNLLISGNSLTNFIQNAELLVEQSLSEMAMEWNIDCAGKFSIPDQMIHDPSVSTLYRIVNDGKTLHVFGDIENGYAEKVIAAIIQNPTVSAVALSSGGGNVGEAIRAGTFIRSRGLTTTLWGSCHSACPLVFLGGEKRVVYQPTPDLGFHQISEEDGDAVPLSHTVYTVIREYISEMGADPAPILLLMKGASPSEMTRVNAGDDVLCQSRFVQWVQYACYNDID